jgi:acetylglutamate kinase
MSETKTKMIVRVLKGQVVRQLTTALKTQVGDSVEFTRNDAGFIKVVEKTTGKTIFSALKGNGFWICRIQDGLFVMS